MALGMKHWVGVVVVGFALVSAWRLPPAVFEPHTGGEITHEEARLRALSQELREAHFTLQRQRWTDSLAALVVADGSDGIALIFPEGDAIGEYAREESRQRIAAAEATLEGRRSEVALGFVYQPLQHAAHPEARIDPRSSMETYVGTRDGVGYCFRVRAVSEQNLGRAVLDDLSDASWSDQMGPCLLYGRYGSPGEDVFRWLEAGGINFALGQTERVQPFARLMVRRNIFGISYYRGTDQLVQIRCVAGVADACERVFLTPSQVDNEVAQRQATARRAGIISTRGRGSSFFGQGAFILADLEREFGSEAFEHFWTSEAPIGQAFESAFGIEAGAWIVRWLGTFTIVQPPGPGLPQSSSSGGLLAIALFAGIAFLRERRRSVQ